MIKANEYDLKETQELLPLMKLEERYHEKCGDQSMTNFEASKIDFA